MAEIKDFINPDTEGQIQESFKGSRHLEWIAIRSQMLELLLGTLLYISLEDEQKDKSNIEYIKSLSFANLIRMCSIKGLIDNNLRDNLLRFKNNRNLALHNAILKNEKLEKIDLKQFFEDGYRCFGDLLRQLTSLAKVKTIKDLWISELKNKLKEQK